MAPTYLLSAGSNARGQLAIGSEDDAHAFTRASFLGSPQGQFPSDTGKIAQIACGSNFTLLLLDRPTSAGICRELWASGDGDRGQLGPSYKLKDECSRLIFSPVDLHLGEHGLGAYCVRFVAAGWETSYAVLSCPGNNDILVSFGANDFGDLGVGHLKGVFGSSGHVHVLNLKDSHRTSDEYTLTIDFVVASTHHVVAQCIASHPNGTSESIVFGWGTCRHGQLGIPGRPGSTQLSPMKVQSFGSDAFLMGAVGAQHTTLLRSSCTLEGLGSNRKSQLTGLNQFVNVTSVDCTWNGTYAVANDGTSWRILATGDNSKGQLGHDTPDDKPQTLPTTIQFPFSPNTRELVKMVCGSEHVLCLFMLRGSETVNMPSKYLIDTEVWGWGWNEHGNLGVGHAEDMHMPTKVWPNSKEPRLSRAVDIWAGCGTSWIAVEDLGS